VSLKLYRPARGGLEPSPGDQRNWRRKLRSPRWNAASLENPEARLTSPLQAALFFLGLGIFTFIVLVIGYGIGFWGS
jgi:hypothetical protein